MSNPEQIVTEKLNSLQHEGFENKDPEVQGVILQGLAELGDEPVEPNTPLHALRNMDRYFAGLVLNADIKPRPTSSKLGLVIRYIDTRSAELGFDAFLKDDACKKVLEHLLTSKDAVINEPSQSIKAYLNYRAELWKKQLS